MNKLVLYTDTGKVINYKIKLQGANIANTFSRLCLEFETGENLYFKGNIDEKGNCNVNITKLEKFEGKGNAKIEIIAEGSYFPIHEMPFLLSKRVKIAIEGLTETKTAEEIEEESKPSVSFQFTESDIIEDKPIVETKKKKKKIKKEEIIAEKVVKEIEDFKTLDFKTFMKMNK